MDDTGGDVAAVAAANAAFYRAFESGEMAAMDAVWEHSDRVSCTHPGMPAVHGWEAVRTGWQAIRVPCNRRNVYPVTLDP